MLAAGVEPDAVRTRRVLDMRFRGQGHEIEVALPEGHDLEAAFADLATLFREAYAEVFTSSPLAEAIEIVNWKVEARGPDSSLSASYRVLAPPGAEPTETRARGRVSPTSPMRAISASARSTTVTPSDPA